MLLVFIIIFLAILPTKHLPCLLDEGKDSLLRLGTEHGDACFAVVGDAFEEGRGGEVAADMKDAA